MNKLLFPYKKVRPIQTDLINDIQTCVQNKSNAILHAPTGLGKTIASLAPTLKYAIDNGLTIFFLTSRHTQHMIAIETLKLIKEKLGEQIISVDIIGKKHMCPQPGSNILSSFEFSEYCKKLKEEGRCNLYNNTKKKNQLTSQAKRLFDSIKPQLPLHVEKMVEICQNSESCPYEISIELGKKANIVICDYYYIFSPGVSKTFFMKTNKNIEKSIVIVDEAHNLPFRIRDLLTKRLTAFMLMRAISEAKKHGYDETMQRLQMLKEILDNYGNRLSVNDEILITKDEFVKKIELTIEIDQLIADLEFIAADIREKQKRSYIGGIADFLQKWLGDDKGFARIVGKNKSRKFGETISISYRCLDPSLVASEIINETYSTILMSGTLTPTSMYRDLLGFPENTFERVYKSPFPKENKLSLVVPKTTTKFTMRNEKMYEEIGKVCVEIVNNVPGNSVVFFPSYYLRNEVNKYFSDNCKKTTFTEESEMSKIEKQDLLERFKKYKDSGAVLLGVMGANFAEGIDLPGDLLKCVVVVGLPLRRPDLETKELIKYFDEKFGKGWDYGYLFPAMNKCFQSTGRCIRSETDRGVVVYLDARYKWQNYYRCFQEEVKISEDYVGLVKEFFGV
tara:strand:- start:4495 stop:6357 length:1863 start_codon:yes stop_codon:yes gene_type:complete